MPVPITNMKVSDIARELGRENPTDLFQISELFTSQDISPYGLDPTYCTGATPEARLINLKFSSTYRFGKFRNYRYGLVLFNAANKLCTYNPANGVFTEIATIPICSDIAMTDTKFWCFNSTTPTSINEYTLNQATPSISFVRSILFSGVTSPTALHAMNDSTLIIGGDGQIKFFDISGSTAVNTHTIAITGHVEGDLLYLPISDVILVLETIGTTYYLRKYSMAGAMIASNPISYQCFAMFSHRDYNTYLGQGQEHNVYVFGTNGNLYLVDLTNLSLVLIRNNYGLPGTIQGASNTHFNMINL